MALAPPPAQSLALGDHLEDELPEYSDDDIDAIDLELDEDELESETFRWQSPSTQNRQNYHLKLYERFVRAILRRPKDIPPAELRLLAFPDDTELLIKRNKKSVLLLTCYFAGAVHANLVFRFLSYVYKKARPRSRATGEHIEYQTLSQYRDSIIFWVPRMYADRGITPPNSSELHAEMTKMMRLVITKYPGAAKQTKEKTWLGLAELRQLLDYEMLNNRCIENSEQHQVAWLIGRTTAVRPGTLCRIKDNRNEVLKWKHLEFTREGDGRFMVIINFVNIAIKNSNDPEKSTRISFKCRIKAPTAENMIFSIPHRLLVIALRRKAVLGVDAEGIDAIDDVLSGDLYNIRICPDFMDQPVFLASKPRGLALNDEGAPLGVPNLSAYLNDRGEALGYIARISYYSIRRRVATELAKKLGPDEARILIGHKPDTWTLEEYYLELGAIYDATAVAFGEEIGPGGFSEEMLKVWAPLAAERLTSQALERTRGAALDALTKQLIMRDPNCPGDDANDLQLKAYRKRVRLYAQKALVAQEADLQHSTVTLTDMQQRRAQFEQSAFAAHVVEKAKIYMDATDVEIDGIDRDEATGEEHQDSRDHETDFQVEPDLESRPLENGAVITFEAEGDVESGAVDEPSSPVSSYETVAKVFMQTIMENTLTAFSMWKDGDRTCTLCIADETMSDEARVCFTRLWAPEYC